MSQSPKRGTLEVVHGSMFGGKTERMIAVLREAVGAGKRVMAFKHVIDDRYDPEHLVTHRNETFDAIRVPNADAILKMVMNGSGVKADFIAVDEGHFFKMPLIPVVKTLLEKGVSVIVAGITNDAWGRPFEPMPQLTEMADRVVVKQAPCRVCGNPAAYTQRITQINTLHMVGGLSDYEPRCGEHFTPFPGPPEHR
ncbi:MAG: thymidine kinase [Planctomycetes bacterium]|nr:thymidine kinase [Planctomycetota bacterium]